MKISEERLVEWMKVSQKLKELKAEEQALRKELCSILFDNQSGEFKTSTETEHLVVVAESKVTRNIDATALTTMLSDLTDQERKAINYKPNLVLREYRKLPEDSKLHSVIIERPAMPTLDVTIKPMDD